LSILAVVFGGLYVVANGLAVVVAIVVAVSVEEAVYRFALPAILAMILMKIGVAKRLALIIAVVVAIGFFAAMPGHVTQLVDVRSWSAFLAFSLLMTHAVWRGRSLFAPIVAHAVYDFATIGMQNGDISSALRVAGAAATLLALVVIAAHPKVRVIDIRDSVSVLGGSAGGSLPSIIDDGELASEAPDGSLR
jgi:membrane protease YdiL (CAAX protease family)